MKSLPGRPLDRFLRQFDAETRRRGELYWQEGRVRLGKWDGPILRGSVRGTRTDEVWFLGGNSSVEADCDCPRFEDGIPCKHIVAALCEADVRGLLDRCAGIRSLDFDFWDEFPDDPFDFDDEDAGDDSPAESNAASRRPLPPIHRSPPWENLAARVDQALLSTNRSAGCGSASTPPGTVPAGSSASSTRSTAGTVTPTGPRRSSPAPRSSATGSRRSSSTARRPPGSTSSAGSAAGSSFRSGTRNISPAGSSSRGSRSRFPRSSRSATSPSSRRSS